MPQQDIFEAEAQEYLDRFDQDPRAAMAETPRKFDAGGCPLETRRAFSDSEVVTGEYVLHRDSVRKHLKMVIDGAVVSLENVLPGKAPIENIDHPKNLVDDLRHVRLEDMEAAGLRSANLPEIPWSDDYWALYLGCLGRRYADPAFPGSTDWEDNYEYVRARPMSDVLRSGDGCAIDQLSPSEKYDLLVGSAGGALTRAMWDEGRFYHESAGTVEAWMGICHGWAPASYMLPRPGRRITLLAADGVTPLVFYPSDIKALASLLWAKAQTVTRFIGSRCRDKDPATDEVGRVISKRAFDTNPGTWHMSVINQVGAARRAFVMDATYDAEVWNQPVCGYTYNYFNPQRMKLVKTLAAATVPRGDFSKDRFGPYRSARAASFAGIVMNVRYVAECQPDHKPTAGPDRVVQVQYKYDLELDKEGRILGGEWYTGKRHPDFLWTPPHEARAITPAEQLATGTWDVAAAVPPSWRKAAAQAADRGMPLAKIVEQLIRLAQP